MTTRYLPPMAGAVAMTFALFFVMQLLVSQQMITTGPIEEFFPMGPRVKIMPQTEPVEVDPVKKEAVIQPPGQGLVVRDPAPKIKPGPFKFPGAGVTPGEGGTKLVALGPGSTEMVPLFITPPVYPVGRLRDGTEGYVVLEFAVSELGNVSDPHVLYAEPQGAFGEAAKRAILKSRFKAMIVDGKPAAVTGVRYKYVFRIE